MTKSLIAVMVRADGGQTWIAACPEVNLLLAEDVAHAADLGAYAAELFFDVLVAAVDVVDAVEDGLAVGDEGGEDERRRRRGGRST